MRFFQKRVNIKKKMPLPSKYLGLIQQGTSPDSLITRGCLSPRKIFVYNSLTCKNEPLWVDCGHCVRCKDQRREEMATRMILHRKSKPWAHAYFITLTYGSYNLSVYHKHPFLRDWLNTYPVKDTYNSKGLPRWTPSIIVPDHFTKFMKRLRIELPSHIISYVVAGELGGTFGRPHFHAILYSDKPISKQNILDAWSLDCYEKTPLVISRYCGGFCKDARRFRFHIGKVDYNDLNLNGTCDFDSVKNPADFGNTAAKNCFAYVAKYCVKDSENMNQFAKKRYLSVWNKLQNAIPIIENHFSQNKTVLFSDKVYLADSYLCEEDIEKIKANITDYINNCPVFTNIPPFLVDFIINNTYVTKIFKKNGKTYQVNFKEFCKVFGTYFSQSRMYSIGKGYFEQNYQNFAVENYSLRKVQGKTLVFPSYYYRLLEQRKFGIRFRARTESGISLCKCSLPLVERFFTKFRVNEFMYLLPPGHSLDSHSIFSKDRFDDDKKLIYPCSKSPYFSETDPACGFINPYSTAKGSLLDISLYRNIKGKYRYINYIYDVVLDEFLGLSYNRKLKQFTVIDSLSRLDVCDFVLSRIYELKKKYPQVEQNKLHKLELYNICYESDFTFRSEEEILNFLNSRNIMQSVYESEHFTKDNL